MSDAAGHAFQAQFERHCNSLHTNKMQRPSRTTNIIETLSQESTIEF